MGTEPSAVHVLAENLRRLMEAGGPEVRTQAALAKLAGVDQKTISNMLNPAQRQEGASGRMPSPALAQVEKVAAALGMPVWKLLRPANRN